MGRKTNREFYEIPYRRLINKLTDRFKENNQKVDEVGEAYTSKCDALALEPIRAHKKYNSQTSFAPFAALSSLRSRLRHLYF